MNDKIKINATLSILASKVYATKKQKHNEQSLYQACDVSPYGYFEFTDYADNMIVGVEVHSDRINLLDYHSGSSGGSVFMRFKGELTDKMINNVIEYIHTQRMLLLTDPVEDFINETMRFIGDNMVNKYDNDHSYVVRFIDAESGHDHYLRFTEQVIELFIEPDNPIYTVSNTLLGRDDLKKYLIDSNYFYTYVLRETSGKGYDHTLKLMQMGYVYVVGEGLFNYSYFSKKAEAESEFERLFKLRNDDEVVVDAAEQFDVDQVCEIIENERNVSASTFSVDYEHAAKMFYNTVDGAMLARYGQGRVEFGTTFTVDVAQEILKFFKALENHEERILKDKGGDA